MRNKWEEQGLNDILDIIPEAFVVNTLVCSNFSFIPAVINMHFKSLHGIYSLCFHGSNKTDSSDMEISIFSKKCFLAKLSWIRIKQLNVKELYLYRYHIIDFFLYIAKDKDIWLAINCSSRGFYCVSISI